MAGNDRVIVGHSQVYLPGQGRQCKKCKPLKTKQLLKIIARFGFYMAIGKRKEHQKLQSAFFVHHISRWSEH